MSYVFHWGSGWQAHLEIGVLFITAFFTLCNLVFALRIFTDSLFRDDRVLSEIIVVSATSALEEDTLICASTSAFQLFYFVCSSYRERFLK